MYCVVDVETNGVFDFSRPAEAEGQPRIAAAAFIWASDDFQVQHEASFLVRPDGWIMPPEAAAINRLTTEQLRLDGVPIANVLAVFTEAVDDGRVFIAFGAQFDMKAFRAECRRAGMDDRFEKTLNICAMRACTGVVKATQEGSKRRKFPTLAEAYQHFYKRPFSDPHTALADARACLEVARFLKRIGCLPEPAVHHAKPGTKAGQALAARQGTLAVDAEPGGVLGQ